MKRFDLVTEADARMLEPGTTIELLPGGHVTPLARDTLAARRITVIDGASGASGVNEASRFFPVPLAPLVPPVPPERVAVASDHAGVGLKRELVRHLRSRGLTVDDLGTHGSDPVDYPDVAAAVARAVARREADAGVIIDGAGIGSAIAANKVRGVRAAMATSETIARYSREHNGANVLTLGATLTTIEEACSIADAWLSTTIREPRYLRRLEKIRRLEEEA